MTLSTPNSSWTEFDWERLLRKNDEIAHRYLQLLDRFHDLPGAEKLIAHELGDDFKLLQPGPEIPADQEGVMWIPGLDDEDYGDENDAMNDFGADRPTPAGGPDSETYFYEKHPLYTSLLHSCVNWGNIYALLLPDALHKDGIATLYHINRALATAIYSIGDGKYAYPNASIAFAKRCLSHINRALGGINAIEGRLSQSAQVIQSIRKRLLQSQRLVVEHLQLCRAKALEKGV